MSLEDPHYVFEMHRARRVGERVARGVPDRGATTGGFPEVLTKMPLPQHFQWFLGPPMSGAPLHSHTNAWNCLLYGRKRW